MKVSMNMTVERKKMNKHAHLYHYWPPSNTIIRFTFKLLLPLKCIILVNAGIPTRTPPPPISVLFTFFSPVVKGQGKRLIKSNAFRSIHLLMWKGIYTHNSLFNSNGHLLHKSPKSFMGKVKLWMKILVVPLLLFKEHRMISYIIYMSLRYLSNTR